MCKGCIAEFLDNVNEIEQKIKDKNENNTNS